MPVPESKMDPELTHRFRELKLSLEQELGTLGTLSAVQLA